MDRNHVEPIVEVFAEASGGDLLLQILVGRRDDAHVDLDRVVAADRPDLPVLEHPQQLALQLGPHVADLVEEEGAAGGLLEEPALGRVGPGERAAHVAEELALEQAFGQRRAVDRHEGLRRPRAVEVQRARHHLLAGAALAGDQHAAGPAGDLPDQRHDLGHRRALALQVAQRRFLGHGPAQLPILLLEGTPLEGPLHRQQDGVGLERLRDVVERARAHGVYGRVDAAERRHQDHGDVGAEAAQLAHQLDPAAAGHAHVAEHGVELALPGTLDGHVGRLGLLDREALLPEQRGQHLAHGGVVVDDQETLRRFAHGFLPEQETCQRRARREPPSR